MAGDDGLGPRERRVAAETCVGAVVEVVHRITRPHGERPTMDLMASAVVEPEPAGPAASLDAEPVQRCPVVVDPLVRVADEKKIVRPLVFGSRATHGGADQAPLGR